MNELPGLGQHVATLNEAGYSILACDYRPYLQSAKVLADVSIDGLGGGSQM